MAQPSNGHIIGLDVSKATLDVFEWDTERAYSIANEATAIEHWLAGLDAPARLAIEPTNTYHRVVAVAAYAQRHQVYLIDPYRLTHYRTGVGQRVKADPQDAQLLARYLAREAGDLKAWAPLTPGQQRFWHLLRRRATLVRSRVQLRASLTDMGSLQVEVDALLGHCEQTIRTMDRALMAEAKHLGWAKQQRCRAIPGIGPLTAMAMVAAYHRGPFRSIDAFIAFMGMDVRVRESGQWRGQCKLTKKGDPELRRLLFNAAMQGRRNSLWEPYYLRLRARGMSTTESASMNRTLSRNSLL